MEVSVWKYWLRREEGDLIPVHRKFDARVVCTAHPSSWSGLVCTARPPNCHGRVKPGHDNEDMPAMMRGRVVPVRQTFFEFV